MKVFCALSKKKKSVLHSSSWRRPLPVLRI
jgi:hypothetical protein